MLELSTSLRLGGPFSLFGNNGGNSNSTSPEISDLLRNYNQLLGTTSDLLSRVGRGNCSAPSPGYGGYDPYQPPGQSGGCFPAPPPNYGGGCCPVSPPDCGDGSHPEGSLQVEGDTITTPGGYEIKQLGQHEWSITGPDGATTRVWGDPHVDEGDREGATDWDFKRNSTFVLGDGTRINVSTVPHGDNGMTVTGGLEVISGNERVQVSGIGEGKGQIGEVTQDGYAHANNFAGADVFVMGDQADDWSHQGREVLSSNNGGDSFGLGDEMGVGGGSGDERVAANDRFEDWARSVIQNLMQAFENTMQQLQQGPPAGTDQSGGRTQSGGGDRSASGCDRGCGSARPNNLREAIEDLRQMMQTLLSRFGMNDDLRSRRGSVQA